jgi:hypothetical protein
MVSCVADKKVVGRVPPLKFTTEFTTGEVTKPVPLTVSVCIAVPAVTEAGERLVMVGAGLGSGSVVNVVVTAPEGEVPVQLLTRLTV